MNDRKERESETFWMGGAYFTTNDLLVCLWVAHTNRRVCIIHGRHSLYVCHLQTTQWQSPNFLIACQWHVFRLNKHIIIFGIEFQPDFGSLNEARLTNCTIHSWSRITPKERRVRGNMRRSPWIMAVCVSEAFTRSRSHKPSTFAICV